MSTPEEGSPGSRSIYPKYVFRYTCHVEGEKFAQGVARRRTRSFEAEGAPKLEVDYDRSRHVIKIAQEGGETAVFDDRPARFLLIGDLRGQTLLLVSSGVLLSEPSASW